MRGCGGSAEYLNDVSLPLLPPGYLVRFFLSLSTVQAGNNAWRSLKNVLGAACFLC
jgi:hypothetical protein